LKQATAKGFQSKPLPLTELDNVYDFLLHCRRQRDHTLSMTLEEVKETVQRFKKSFLLWGTFNQKEMAAAAISIRVHPDILYNFYSGHLKKFDAVSPAVMLIRGMYNYCGSHHIHWLDLGTSSVNGLPNFSLLDFKLRLGAIPSMKLTFEKELV
jgi:lipid II:glycine glycyltransferase (peptidoglycan interpeptide bridge formation enzyme)